MSEKHGQLGAQWTKSAAAPIASAAALASAQSPIPLQKLPNTSPNFPATSHPYGNCGIPGLPGIQPADIPYTSGRFQAPSIIHAKASPLTIVPVGSVAGPHCPPQVSPTSHHTNVPVTVTVPAPSGFVPPPFTNAGNATTSVLQANPFATVAGNAFANAFNFNTAQQLMHAMSGASAASATGAAATTPNTATGTPVIAGVGPTQRHPIEAVPTTSGVINSTIAENVMNALSNSNSASEEKMRRVKQVIEASIDDNAKLQISQILERVAVLKPIEKLFLYLRLPGECADSDPLRQPQNPLGTRSEINHTINWVRSHLEHDAQVSIPKQDVYNDYIAYCERLSIKPLSTADFGKVMKQVFPGVRPRRLGTRGNSRYCYAAMRKTTKLTPPQLPTLCKSEQITGDDAAAATATAMPQMNHSPSLVLPPMATGDSDNWDVVRSWAEKLLNTKLDSIADLSTRIKSNNATVMGVHLGAKKYTPREPKEKRVLADMGPLKKRRKKKRKGSTSSESSCNQLVAGQQDAGSSQDAIDEPKTEQLIKIKQEIIDSPVHQSQCQSQSQSQSQQQLQQQPPMNYLHQMMPMNLATEQRSNSAVRNLTPKIMEMGVVPPTVVLTQQQDEPSPTTMVIKDEVEDYNTSNIFCKKVLKAQQTKGFWANSPSSGTTAGGGTLLVPPVITTTAATPPPPDISPGPMSMGPPAQMMISSSVSPSSSMDSNNTTPKVASRNMILLRAKRMLAAESAAALTAAAEDSGLPENLGLPRERVISICNMDKHELDDYFLPVEDEENSEEPDTELLQYFQMGDAEEKQLNSLDAVEQNRNPQGAPTTTSTTTTIQAGMAPAMQQQQQTHTQQPQSNRGATAAMPSPQGGLVVSSTLLPGQANVGSASASLALMSKKHQHQQNQQHQPQQQQPPQHSHQQQQLLQLRTKQLPTNGNPNQNNRRKISLSNASSNGSNKNCIFLPISPNINNGGGGGGAPPPAATTTQVPQNQNPTNSSQNCFASPGVTRMRQRSSLLTKQQSLDCDGNRDPMIGATRRKRCYVYSYPTSTSASAPPSPSLLQQCMVGNWPFGGSNSFPDTNSADPMINQNSMDLETSLALTGGDDLDLTETQRSQSVPLSQLQRSCHPSPSFNRQTSFQASSYASDTFYSENSNSQNSVAVAPLKDVEAAAALLYEVDVGAMISPSFNNKFGNISQQTATTCSSSAGSSSGYSSGGSAGIVSRSVPSTPLPHQQQNNNSLAALNGNGGDNGVSGGGSSLNATNGFFNISPSFNWETSSNGIQGGPYVSYSARNTMDISKSMPTTPITTPCFRYSPVELHRDFLINGCTIDLVPSSAFVPACIDENPALTLSSDSLMDDSSPSSILDTL
ncbi:uncharacterized protein LOC117896439 [Drosophila subobscura]|uniref:uncharacterized protein LOC117896439 n=1 Tax=Drosophila subobscura TaxID=7241 RepID=UPI00155B31A6|nr:uncharacterized protein LOC117896439 [Drosophila subobscura]